MTTTIETPQTATAVPRAERPVPRPAPRRLHNPLLIAGAIALLIVLAVGWVLLAGVLGGPNQPTPVNGPREAPFRLSVPENWRTFSQEELAALPGKPVAVMQREDGKGFFVVRTEGRSPTSFESFASDLDRQFERKLPDFQKRTSRTLRIKAGRAFFYSYIRRRGGTVHTVVLVPAGAHSYAINTVTRGGEDDVAKEIGRMIVSFDT